MMTFRRWLLVAGSILCISIVIGATIPFGISLSDTAPLGDIISEIDQLSGPVIFVIILLNNVIALVFSFCLSPLFCIVPMIALVLNGMVIGIVASAVLEQESMVFLMAGLLPHGIFELPALIIAFASALNFGSIVSLSIFKRELRSSILPSLLTNLKRLAVAIGLLIPAAFIESFITPWLLDAF